MKVLRSKRLTAVAMKLVSPRPLLSITWVAGEQGVAVATFLDEAPVRKDLPVFIGAAMPKALDVPNDGPSSFRVETNGDNRWWS